MRQVREKKVWVTQTATHQKLPTLRRAGGSHDGLAEPVYKIAWRRRRAAHDGPKYLVDGQLRRQVLDELQREEDFVRGDRWQQGRGSPCPQ